MKRWEKRKNHTSEDCTTRLPEEDCAVKAEYFGFKAAFLEALWLHFCQWHVHYLVYMPKLNPAWSIKKKLTTPIPFVTLYPSMWSQKQLF